jgi:hypothetical protein
MNRTERLALVFIVLAFVPFFMIFIYPSVNEFDYWHMATAIQAERSGHLQLYHQTPAFYIGTIALSEVTGISYDAIPTLPLQALPLVVCLYALMRRISQGRLLYLSVGVVYLFLLVSPAIRFDWFVHNLAFIMLLALGVAVAVSMKSTSLRRRPSMSLVMIILLVGVSLMSYKITFLSVLFIVFLDVSGWLSISRRVLRVSPSESRFLVLTIFTVVFVFWVSRFFYDQFLPALRLSVEGEYMYSSGFEKIFAGFFSKPSDPLSAYYVRSSAPVLFVNLLWNVIAVVGFIGAMVVCLRRVLKGRNIVIGQRIFFALAIAGSLDFLVYGMLGHQGLEFVVLSGLLGYCVMFGLPSARANRIAMAGVFSLLILNTCLIGGLLSGGIVVGSRDSGHFEYMNAVSNWYVDYGEVDESSRYISDVLTGGFLRKSSIAENPNTSTNLALFTRSQLVFLLGENSSLVERLPGIQERFIINYRAQYYLANGWEPYRSWSLYRSSIETNPGLSTIFSSGNFDICIYS